MQNPGRFTYAGWGGSLPQAEVDRRLTQALDLSELDPRELVDALLPTMFAPSAPPGTVEDFAASLAAFHPAGFRAMARACTEDLTDVLALITLPTLLIYGAEDTRAPAGVASALHQAIAESALVQIAGAGHICNVDAPDQFNGVLRGFLRSYPPH